MRNGDKRERHGAFGLSCFGAVSAGVWVAFCVKPCQVKRDECQLSRLEKSSRP